MDLFPFDRFQKIRLGSSLADPMSLFHCHVALTVSQYEVLIWSKSQKGTEHMQMVQRSLSHKHARWRLKLLDTTVVFSLLVFVSVPHRACYSDHYPWSGQNIYLYPYLADKNDVDQFKKFSRNLELKRRVCKLFKGLHCHLTPHLSNYEPGQLVLEDKKIKFCQPTLWSLTIVPLYFGLSLLLFSLISALVPCPQLIWTEYHNH